MGPFSYNSNIPGGNSSVVRFSYVRCGLYLQYDTLIERYRIILGFPLYFPVIIMYLYILLIGGYLVWVEVNVTNTCVLLLSLVSFC